MVKKLEERDRMLKEGKEENRKVQKGNEMRGKEEV